MPVISPRTDREVLEQFCLKSGYTPVLFHAVDENGMDIYHTNVLMCVGSSFVVICLESIKDTCRKGKCCQCYQGIKKTTDTYFFRPNEPFCGKYA